MERERETAKEKRRKRGRGMREKRKLVFVSSGRGLHRQQAIYTYLNLDVDSNRQSVVPVIRHPICRRLTNTTENTKSK